PPKLIADDIQMEVTKKGNTKVLLSWQHPQTDLNVPLRLAGFYVTAQSTVSTFSRTLAAEDREVALDSLEPWTSYAVILRPFYSLSGSPDGDRKFGRAGSITIVTGAAEDSFIDDQPFKCPGTSKVISRENVCDAGSECPQAPADNNSPDESDHICVPLPPCDSMNIPRTLMVSTLGIGSPLRETGLEAGLRKRHSPPYHIMKKNINLRYWNVTRRSITLSWDAQHGDSGIPLELAGYVVTYWTDKETVRHVLPPKQTSHTFEKLSLLTTFRFIVRPFYTPDGRVMGERRYQRCSAMWHTVVLDDDEYPDDKGFRCTTTSKFYVSEVLCDRNLDCDSNKGSPDEDDTVCVPRSLKVHNKNLYMEIFYPTTESVSLRWLPAGGDRSIPLFVAGYLVTARWGDWTRRLEVSSNQTTAVMTGLAPWRKYKFILRPFFTADGDPHSVRKYGYPQTMEFSTKMGGENIRTFCSL
ncbi:hypothetical protein MTO96_039147, partial [Rhipicephalus appendiculatus]